jgi:RHS repeat-associated protein
MHRFPLCLVRVVLLVAAAAFTLPGRAAAQCTEEPCGPLDGGPPMISISPVSGPYPPGARTVTISFSDDVLLDHGSRVIRFAGQDVTGTFTYTQSTNWTTRATGSVTIGTGSQALTAYICDGAANCTTETATYTGATPSVRVEAESPTLSVPSMSRGVGRFRVVNTGTFATTFGVSATCSLHYSCSASTDSVALAAGASAWVDVSFATPAIGGSVTLTATAGTASQGASTGINTLVQPDPGFPGDGPSLERIERSACITVSLAPGVASECGDLRVAHALPSTRVLNRARTPVLTYNSNHARPIVVVAEHLAGPAEGAPDSIRAVLLLNGVQAGTGRWRGWGPDQTRRIAVSLEATNNIPNTGVYSYTLEVTAAWLNGTQRQLKVRSGQMIIINRRHSPFGAGWWPAGVEQLVEVTGDTLKLWVGGDGSAHLYRGPAGGPWRAAAYDGADSLHRAVRDPFGSVVVRTLPDKTEVWFDTQGRHLRTVNRLQQYTEFRWNPAAPAYLDQIVTPYPAAQGGVAQYTFAYENVLTSGARRLSRVSAPGAGATRDTWVRTDATGRVMRIRDPGGDSITFAYHGSTGWLYSRTDRRGGLHTFGYERVRFYSSSRRLNATETATTHVQSAITHGLNGVSLSMDSVRAWYDGPRTDLCDCRWWHVNRWGAPVDARDPLGNVTLIRRGDPRFPALVTETVAPNGFKATATYDAQANVASTTAWNPYGDGRHATTTYRWHPYWNKPFQVIASEGEVSLMAYDTVYGRRLWEQVGPDAARRVDYQYYPLTDPAAPGLLRAVVAPLGSTETITYDARGNLATVTGPPTAANPQGATTEYLSDEVGKVLRTRTPVLGGGPDRFQQDTLIYDGQERVRETISTGPAMNGVEKQWLHVRNQYDPEGNLTEVARWSVPDAAGVDTIRTRWEYDLAGRPIVEIAPDGTPGTWADNPRDSTFYDLAGNVVRVRTRRFAESRAATGVDSTAYIRMRYDALNRLTQRILPPVRYEPRAEGIPVAMGEGNIYPYPYIPGANTNTGLRIPADTSTFEYDPQTGLQKQAVNGNARVMRTYYANGQLRYDSLYTRTVEGADFTAHPYGLEYRYDRAGRSTQLLHPSQLRPPLAASQGRTGNEFAYDPVTGALARVTDPMGNEFRFTHTLRGEPETLALPGGITHRYAYNAGGQLQSHQIENAGTGGGRYGTPLIRDETFSYDVRGKLHSSENRATMADTLIVQYSGLGHLVGNSHQYVGYDPQTRLTAQHYARERPTHDAMGNILEVRRSGTVWLHDGDPWDATHMDRDTSTAGMVYQWGTGRLRVRGSDAMVDTIKYDLGGNEVFVVGLPVQPTGQRQDRASFYDGGGRLWATNVRRVANASSRGGLFTTFEEYRLDALGRRVLVRTRKECENPGFDFHICTTGSVRRTVWAGDQELYEIQMPDWALENDAATLPIQPRFAEGHDPNPLWGRVAYTYGGAIDRPLSVVRMGYTNALSRWDEFAIVPHWNAHGTARTGTYHDGQRDRCKLVYQNSDQYRDYCVQLEWSDGLFPYNPSRRAGEHWQGTLLNEKRDASGLLYRRNRYYDPATGRFTQEDPIGLAGGVNLYGFANGDPVSYSDPYGLCPPGPCDDSPENSPEGLQAQARALYSGAKWLWRELNTDLCPASSGCRGGAADFGLVGGVGPARALGALRSVAPGRWRSSAGLIYGQGSVHGNRVRHVLAHAAPDASKKTHSVFLGGERNVLGLIDEAWTRRGGPLANDPGAYVVNMGRTVGTAGEQSIRIIVRPGTSELITAYPVH